MDNNERITHYRFTAYLIKSIKTYKQKYSQKRKLQQQIETLVDDFDKTPSNFADDFTADKLLTNGMNNTAFEKALENVKARDVRILMLHLLENYSLKEISSLMDINYNTVLSIYARARKKIKTEMEDNNNEF